MISSIRLQNFRSYDDRTFEFGDGVNVIVGPNAAGKTNLLESVLVVCSGGSFKARDCEMVKNGAEWMRLDADTSVGKRTTKIIVEPLPSKSYDLDGKILSRLLPSRTIPTVLFEPNHLFLLSGSPDARRKYLDDLIEKTDLSFYATRNHYKRVLAQRNSLLKNNSPHLLNDIFVWNFRLSELGGQIAKKRFELVEELNAQLSNIYSEISGKPSQIRLDYLSKFHPKNYETELLKKLEHNLDKETQRGYTLYGPHRDDFEAQMDGQPMQVVSSRGEVRTMVLTLKILELIQIQNARNQKPIFLLDDVFSELDSTRRAALARYTQTHQTFITTTDSDMLASGANINQIFIGKQ